MSGQDAATENVEKLKKAYHVWHASLGQDPSEWLKITSPNLSLRSLGEGRPGMEFTKARNGREQLQDYLKEIHVDWIFLGLHVDEFIAQGDRVVMLGRGHLQSRRTGKEVKSPLVHVWRFQDGQAVDFFELYDTLSGLAAMTPDPATT